MGACIGGGSGGGGGTLANPGGNVYINGGTFSINVDWAGAAIGGGGYSGGNDALGGNLIITGGSLRTVCDENALSNWGSYGITQYGVTDKVITALKLNSANEPVYALAFDTSLLSTPADFFRVSDGIVTIYEGGNHHYRFVNEEKNKDTDVYETITATNTNWVELEEPNLYFFLTGEDHELTVNGETFNFAFDAETSTFSLIDDGGPKVGAPGSGDIDGDGFVTMAEVTIALRAVVSGSGNLTSAQIDALDIDRDGVLTMADVIKIIRIAAGL
jgi:hypothetical protein